MIPVGAKRGVLCGLVAGLAVSAAFSGPGSSAGKGAQSSGLPGEVIRKEYRWTDINSVGSLGEDTRVVPVGGRVLGRRFTMDLTIPAQRLAEAVGSFGIPFAWMRISHRGEEDFQHKLAELRVKAAGRGIAYKESVNAFTPDYAWMVDRSREDVSSTAAGLFAAAAAAAYESEREGLGLLSSFVQSLAHRELPAVRTAEDGTEIYAGGVSMPLEALATGTGDCDTKCVLLGSLLAHVDRAKVVLLLGGDHIFVGVLSVPRPRDRFVRIRNERYVLIELTSCWPVGQVPAENMRVLRMMKFEIIPLVGFN